MRVFVLGGSGLIGSVIVSELMRDNVDVTVIDLVKPRFNVDYVFGDLNNIDDIAGKIRNADYVINAAQYYFNINAMKACLKAGVNYMDLGGLFWMTRKQLELNNEFEREGLLALIGIGAEPGITNVVAEWIYRMHGTPISIRIRDGWISRSGKINWSVDTQLDELTMKAPVFEDGEYKYYDPASRFEYIDFIEPIGRVKTYLTIHSELATFPQSFSGVRYVDWMEGGTGFEDMIVIAKLFGDNAEVMNIKSRAYLRELLRTKGLLGYSEGENPDEWESAKVIFDYGDRRVEVEFMSGPHGQFDGTQYMTGLPAAVAALSRVNGKGVLPPERVIDPEPFINKLKEKGLVFYYRENRRL
ncbi:saccharopine dehydrogenase [Vulcanisaeta moutnovskia 768-28]|uniref:Saccharopine dehydrogenase n=1 Tax=Vulcanisaeta moutnovskia (strain 768-28) TaxID=985053 RepID=F0QYE6_VULM7|nr:saccharopine dehydrogenase NADP-binding domain-containing protein [Vulcanisaeta moutnovskia]ADY01379.1 saccharopine dehydrogenase [Vulcanisaeta moutnovskia 768-28]